ncbi:diacylglycerol/lipid kinase family protein [Nitrosomonas supralitoralis]|uniref:Diacylglycerol kinase n=1 Tax=Nitrosomonas supralitoralis TaxID=2116706 RepID=A0A2P7NS26_9PROT|nr:diacylglycerol kinase family protein [Nitrosomonas supralitoralis]PSJ16260.1 diacylglycerol kinase [Nitrosomonas supralitoralis]
MTATPTLAHETKQHHSSVINPIKVDPAAPLFIVLNASSGNDEAVTVRETIETVLKQAGREFELFLVTHSETITNVARDTVRRARESNGVVVAAGGDGTINAVVQATLGSGCPLGVIAQGTFNYFGRTHNLPEDTAQATRVLLSTLAYPIQVGFVNDRVFLVNASLGLYPQLLEDREIYKRKLGRNRWVAWISGLYTVLRYHRQLNLTIEHKGNISTLLTPTLFVGNNRLQLEQIGIEETSIADRGELTAIAIRPVNTLTMIGLGLRGALGQLGEAEHVLCFSFSSIVVKPALFGRKLIKVATDGEITYLRTPIEFRAADQALYLLQPAPADVK